jgi:hypothetical protein
MNAHTRRVEPKPEIVQLRLVPAVDNCAEVNRWQVLAIRWGALIFCFVFWWMVLSWAFG